MSKQIFVPTDKRTRSQVTLPDHILQVSQHSPFKNARNVTRNTEPLATTSSAVEQEESEDELLLSPQKILKENFENPALRAKRSASPTRTNATAQELEMREPKRPRLDADADTTPTHRVVAHKHNYSESDILPKARASRRRNANTSSKKPLSTASEDLSQSRSPKQRVGKERARSVPVFPSTMQVPIPHLDLTKLPPSPTRARARSRSPSKEFEAAIRITTMPSALPDRLEPIPDEGAAGQDVIMEEPNPVGPLGNATVEVRQEPQPPFTEPILDNSAPLTSPKNQAPPPELRLEIPSMLDLPQADTWSPPSPLTPLPDAPQPSRLSLKGAARAEYFKKMESGIAEERTLEHPTAKVVVPEQQPPTKPAGPSRLPRPTQSIKPAHPEQSNATLKPGVETRSTRSGDASKTTAPAQPIKKNAFDVLMQNIQTQKAKGKQKANPPPAKTKDGPSSLKTNNAGPKATTAAKQPPKLQEVEDKPKASLKAKMRPREKPIKSTLVPIPPPVDARDEEQSRPQTPLRQSPSVTAVGTSRGQSPKPIETVPEAQEQVKEADSSAVPLTPSDRPETPSGQPETSTLTEHQDFPAPSTEQTELPAPPTEQQEQPTSVEQPELPAPTDQGPPPKKQQKQTRHKPRQTKANLPEKRAPVTRPAVSRVTRSSSTKGKAPESKTTSAEWSVKPQSSVDSVESTVVATIADEMPIDIPETALAADSLFSDLSDLSDLASEPELSPGSPMRMSSPLPPASSQEHPEPDELLKTPIKEGPASSPVKSSKRTPPRLPEHPHSSPSPTKIARSYTGNRRSIGGIPRRSPRKTGNGPSSLTTLSSALEKLRMPPPSRPNTSMGFNRDADDDELPTAFKGTRDDSAIGRSSPGKARASPSRSSALSAGLGATSGKPLFPSKPGAKTGKPAAPTQQRLTNLFTPTGKNVAGSSKTHFVVGSKLPTARPNGVRIFGVGATGRLGPRGRIAPKVSRKTSLPMVVGSPVKGGGKAGQDLDDSEMKEPGADATLESSGPVAGPSNVNRDTPADGHGNPFSAPDTDDQVIIIGQTTIKGKGKEKDRKTDASRRASMAFNALSQSLSSLPTEETSPPETMGPPITPRGPGRPGLRSASNPHPSSSTSPADGQAATDKSGNGRRAAGSSSTPQSTPKLSLLKDCVIFVDVKTDTGEEAGDLFMEMLKNVGARLLTRVGQSCTHIVYKNGMASTVSRYRLLRDPKPFVVNITWVVDCVEQRTRMDESKYLVDLQHTNVAGTNKRRRSMLPKLISRQFDDDPPEGDRHDQNHEGDMSVDGSNSSMVLDDDLPPLEKARRRKSMLVGPPA
ncbi:hypothetical protein BDN72DRAFT_790075 [Pluteus cervinus]|uniref:Uncharacterized protein n=1 Tax=Pluteus cervinus TaxID=181527 RepID=A0ACD3B8M4_9AGAR|nr:hypothetical protein BDN72DRAFT_790075 [Pluteus cervinus]